MGQKALEDIAKAINKRIEDNKDNYRALLNTYKHTYRFYPARTLVEVKYQLSDVLQYSTLSQQDIDKELETIVTTYCDKLMESFESYSGKIVKVNKIGPYSVTIIPLLGKVTKKGETLDRDVFEFIRNRKTSIIQTYLKEPIVSNIFGDYDKSDSYSRLMKIKDDDTLLSRLSTKNKKSKAYMYNALDSSIKGYILKDQGAIRRDDAGLAMRGGGNTNLGHEKVSAVAKRLRSAAAEDFLSSTDILETVFIENKIKVTVDKYVPKLKRALRNKFVSKFIAKIELFEESQKKNFGDSAEEKRQLNALGKDVTDFLSKLPWADQEGSSTPAEIVLYNIREEIEEGFKKLKDKKNVRLKLKGSKLNISNSSGTVSSGGKSTKTTSSSSNKKPKIKAPSFKNADSNMVSTRQAPQQNWSSLIPILNRKLPDQVAKNMGAPGLVYRTGRFAESARVINVQTTKEGYPSVVFDYERDPYDVFDRMNGASPWNTPARDPRALVDRSVREILQEMAIGRFYTRRA
jgi:hypothetical protein